ncbi:hypothetical protein HU200_065919 [Digitaria exilis]|uniref:UBC core domain-containing protein n=1 Tax=Digitaria exilis TaxID=1010633 RepID=A0A835A220_9POAL|nr:hypothetical protein HU200_065919 [Digitaria exilis]
MLEDATGQPICQYDLVMFQTTDGESHGRGLAVKSLPGKKISVLCVDGTLVAKPACHVTVVDRSLTGLGMAVAPAWDPYGQIGVVTGATTELDLVVHLDGKRVVATGVSPEQVRPVKGLTLGDYVFFSGGTWLGRTIELSVDVDVLFDDRSVCRVTQAGDKLRFVCDNFLTGMDKNGFCPGDRVAGDAAVFKSSRVEMGGVLVYWVAAPKKKKKQKKKKKPRRSSSVVRVGMNKGRQRSGARRLQEELGSPMAIADTRTTVDVLWQDGTRQRGVPSASLLRIVLLSDQDLFPGQHVIDKTLTPVVSADDAAGCVRVVKSLSYKDQTVCVSWTDPGESKEVDTVMSMYELGRSSNHNFFYGDIVVRLPPREQSTSTNDVSWVGHVVDLCDTQYIHVMWGDGNTSKVLLHEIASLEKQSFGEMLMEMGDWVHDEDGDETQEDLPPSLTNNTSGGEGDDHSDGGSDAHDGLVLGATAMDRVGNSIIQAVIRAASGVLAQAKRYWMNRSTPSALRVEPAITGNIQTGGDVDCRLKEAAATDAVASSDSGDDVSHFQHFDVVQSPQDHHYLDNKEQGSYGPREWLKRVQKEWKILEANLPDTIYVRAFEDRMDLPRAVIVGVSGTPYQDGLFFFDMKLPPSYPVTPPEVTYHSFGLRVNPNLYHSGTVCLSLLGTFGGEGPELWSPDTSSILQVIVSIQGLVLTAKPYYNEAGFEAQVGTPDGRRNELPYCENTYLVNLHTMLHLIRRPPVGFQTFIVDHFCRRGQHILRACESYQKEGCPVSTLDSEGCATEASTEQPPCSMGFRLALANVVPRLVEALTEIGAQGCHHP